MSTTPERKAYLDYLARCDQAFRPYAPIDLPEFFAGRAQHIRRLESEVGAPGRHVAIYGERGVGKTSLAKLVYFFLRKDEEHTHFVRCESTSTFDTIFIDVLASAGIDVVLNGVESEDEGQAHLAVSAFSVGGARRVRRTYRKLTTGRQITAKLLVDQLAETDGLVIIDEYDRVRDAETHARMAELIKHFSDADAKTKLILVGVADSLTQLIGEHASLSRSLAQVKLDRMVDDELLEILRRGEEHVQVLFAREVKSRIVRLADGFPYFVHLIGRHAARSAADAIEAGTSTPIVIANDAYAKGLEAALEDAEHSLSSQYLNAVVTTRRHSDKFELVLWALALSSELEVQIQDIARNAEFFTSEKHKAAAFSHHLGELSSDRRSNILTKVREGYYRFTNPLMRPYIRSRMELENLLARGSQWVFPFMQR